MAESRQQQSVQAMFNRIARLYDPMNRIMTAGLDRSWRKRAVELAEVKSGDHVLDLATGTGDLAFELMKHVGESGKVVGADFAQEMLNLAKKKASGFLPQGTLSFEQADALALPYETASFDALTVGFGVRNFSDLDHGFREMVRVTKPGGHVVILEITSPTKPPLAPLCALWFDQIVPVLGRLAGDVDAYSYLPDSVKRFPSPGEVAKKMHDAGLRDVRWIVTAGGIITFHVGIRATL